MIQTLGASGQPEIAAITGQSLKEVGTILDAHYMHRDPALGKAAIRKLEGPKAGRKSDFSQPSAKLVSDASSSIREKMLEKRW